MWNYLRLPFLVFQFFIAEMIIFYLCQPFFSQETNIQKQLEWDYTQNKLYFEGCPGFILLHQEESKRGQKN